ncbi:MAG: metallophosphoesterase [Bacilli bacterium]|nr:metallophosphoesterase [Bacilli bacterium]
MKRLVKLLIFISIIIFIIFFFYYQNNKIVVSNYEYDNISVPKEFNGFKILHISDLHNKKFRSENKQLLNLIRNQEPDIIVITGDLVDRRKYNLENAIDFIENIKGIAPIYYVSGNHEAWSNKYNEVKEELLLQGVVVLDNEKLTITKNNSKIDIIGLKDPGFLPDEDYTTIEIDKILEELSNSSNFKILLSHRPELFDVYSNKQIDIIFTGHAHGGQFRIPLIGAIFAPDQGFFPKYTAGYYTNNFSTMFISRGLGNSVIPIRLFNRPEIILVNLKSDV